MTFTVAVAGPLQFQWSIAAPPGPDLDLGPGHHLGHHTGLVPDA